MPTYWDGISIMNDLKYLYCDEVKKIVAHEIVNLFALTMSTSGNEIGLHNFWNRMFQRRQLNVRYYS